MEKDYIHDIQKIEELENYETFSFKRNNNEEIEICHVPKGIALDLINALGNSLLKESFQKFEK